jgi:hypothetical protein
VLHSFPSNRASAEPGAFHDCEYCIAKRFQSCVEVCLCHGVWVDEGLALSSALACSSDANGAAGEAAAGAAADYALFDCT